MTSSRLARYACALLIAGVLTSCSTTPSAQTDAQAPSGIAENSDGGASEPVSVLASFYPLAYLAEEIGQDLVTVTSLTPSGAEPHDLELSPAQVADLGEADLVVYLSGFQPAVDDAITQTESPALDVAAQVNLLSVEGDTHDHEEADDHDHGDLDPHFWLDPQRMQLAAQAVADRLTALAPEHADDVAANLRHLTTDLAALDASYDSGLAACHDRTLVTSHEAFGYLAARYDLEPVGIAGIDPESEPSPARLREIAQTVADTGVTTIFTQSTVAGSPAQTVADELGIEVAVLDPIESISQLSDGSDYLEVMESNLTALRAGLGCS